MFASDGGVDLARLIAEGLWRPEVGQIVAGETIPYETKLFDLGNLPDPVPASLYFDAMSHCWGNQTYCSTITDDSYRPKLLLGRHVWRSLLPDAYFCESPILVDPPVVLTMVESGDANLNELPRLPVPAYTTGTSESGNHNIRDNSGPPAAAPGPRPQMLNIYGLRPTSRPGLDKDNTRKGEAYESRVGTSGDRSNPEDSRSGEKVRKDGPEPASSKPLGSGTVSNDVNIGVEHPGGLYGYWVFLLTIFFRFLV
jgi:hypothetical protein